MSARLQTSNRWNLSLEGVIGCSEPSDAAHLYHPTGNDGWLICMHSAPLTISGLRTECPQARQRGPHRSISRIAQSGMWHHWQTTAGFQPRFFGTKHPSFVCLHTSPHNHNMAPSPTPNAPRTLAELVELLRDDEMVKVAGELAPFQTRLLTPRRRRGRSSSRQDHVQEQVSFGCRVFFRFLRCSVWLG